MSIVSMPLACECGLLLSAQPFYQTCLGLSGAAIDGRVGFFLRGLGSRSRLNLRSCPGNFIKESLQHGFRREHVPANVNDLQRNTLNAFDVPSPNGLDVRILSFARHSSDNSRDAKQPDKRLSAWFVHCLASRSAAAAASSVSILQQSADQNACSA